jgi:hypothetical protein
VTTDADYSRTALAVIGAKATPEQLAALLPAIVLERIARGGGDALRVPHDIAALVARLSPGS